MAEQTWHPAHLATPRRPRTFIRPRLNSIEPAFGPRVSSLYYLFYLVVVLAPVALVWCHRGSVVPVGSATNPRVIARAVDLMSEGEPLWTLPLNIAGIPLFLGGLAPTIGREATYALMSLVSALMVALLLRTVSAFLRQKGLPRTQRVPFVLAIVGSPFLSYLVSSNMPAALGLSALGLAIVYTVRFVTWGSTYAGFIAGLWYAMTINTFDSPLISLVAIIFIPLAGWFFGKRVVVAQVSVYWVLIFPSLLVVAFLTLSSLTVFGDLRTLAGAEFVTPSSPAPVRDALDSTPISWLTHRLWWLIPFLTVPLWAYFTPRRGWHRVAWIAITWVFFFVIGVERLRTLQGAEYQGVVFVVLTLILVLTANRRLPRLAWTAAPLHIAIGWVLAVGYTTTTAPWIAALGDALMFRR